MHHRNQNVKLREISNFDDDSLLLLFEEKNSAFFQVKKKEKIFKELLTSKFSPIFYFELQNNSLSLA